jgi:translation initiation factor 2 subunit 2
MSLEYNVEELLERAYEKLSDIRKKSERGSAIAPKVTIQNRKTYIKNFLEMCEKILRDPEMVKEYLRKNTKCATSVCDEGLKIDGRLQEIVVKKLVQEFIVTYVQCPNCKSLLTKIEKVDRLHYLKCSNCKSEKTITFDF